MVQGSKACIGKHTASVQKLEKVSIRCGGYVRGEAREGTLAWKQECRCVYVYEVEGAIRYAVLKDGGREGGREEVSNVCVEGKEKVHC